MKIGTWGVKMLNKTSFTGYYLRLRPIVQKQDGIIALQPHHNGFFSLTHCFKYVIMHKCMKNPHHSSSLIFLVIL